MSEILHGRRVLITGATSGIGAAVAEAVVAAGGRVALMARSRERIDELAGRLGDAAIGAPADVTDFDQVASAVSEAAESLGGIDAVVCSAGVAIPGGIDDSGPDDWRTMFEVNVLGVLHTVKASLAHLRSAPLGDVVNISSMSGRRRASVELGFYAASKFAVHVVSDNLREELVDYDVRVTIISPGYVTTPIFDGVEDDARREDLQEALATKGLEPQAVAEQVVHALSQPAGVNLLEIALLSTKQ